MNLVGSMIHNTMDGLAIGVAFATGGKQIIISTVIAIVAHEIPR
jgi:zinc transporter ZupT